MMRSAKDFFRPLAVGAPEPVREIPFKPSRVIHFFPGSNPKMVGKVPEIAPTVDILLCNLEDGVPASDKEAAATVAKELYADPASLEDGWTKQIIFPLNQEVLTSPEFVDAETDVAGVLGDDALQPL